MSTGLPEAESKRPSFGRSPLSGPPLRLEESRASPASCRRLRERGERGEAYSRLGYCCLKLLDADLFVGIQKGGTLERLEFRHFGSMMTSGRFVPPVRQLPRSTGLPERGKQAPPSTGAQSSLRRVFPSLAHTASGFYVPALMIMCLPLGVFVFMGSVGDKGRYWNPVQKPLGTPWKVTSPPKGSTWL